LKATDAASAFDGVAGHVVTAQTQVFYRRRIFVTFTGVFLRMGDTISPAKNALFRRPQYRLGRCAPQQTLGGSDETIGLEKTLENTG
jgi:hypothetical protein